MASEESKASKKPFKGVRSKLMFISWELITLFCAG